MINKETLQTTLLAIVQKQLIPQVISELKEQQLFLKAIGKSQTDLRNTVSEATISEALGAFITYNERISGLLQERFEVLSKQNERFHFEEYKTAIATYIGSLDKTVKNIQSVDRYNVVSTDTKWVKFGKAFKRLFHGLSRVPHGIKNIGRKISGRSSRPFQNALQQVALQNITRVYYEAKLPEAIIPLFDTINSEITKSTVIFWDFDKGIDEKIQKFIKEGVTLDFSDNTTVIAEQVALLEEKITNVSEELQEVCAIIQQQYVNALDRSGTFELPNRRFSTTTIEEVIAETTQELDKKTKRWGYTFAILKDDWDIDLEIYSLIHKTQNAYHQLQQEIVERSTTVVEELSRIEEYQASCHKNIEVIEDPDQLRPAMGKELKELRKNLTNQVIANINQVVATQGFTRVINDFDRTMQGLLEQVSKKRIIAEDTDYALPSSASAINYISPYELISYEGWPSFLEKINETKVAMAMALNEEIQQINSLGQVAEFSLESAMEIFAENKQLEEAKTIALDGLKRSQEKLETIKEQFSVFETTIREPLEEPLAQFTTTLFDFTKNENILAIRLAIAKAKSVEKSKAIKQKIKKNIIFAIPLAIGFVKFHFNRFKEWFLERMMRLGILSRHGAISSELSDFLLEAEQSMQQLPFVYQRLFRSDTLHNDSFFVGNMQKIKLLTTAFENWQKKRFASVIVIGEKGAGKTSIFHYFKKKNSVKVKTSIVAVDTTICTTDGLLEFFNENFSQQIDTLEGWIRFFNSGKKQVIVLENLQYLYFRKIAGFEALRSLSELISSTNKAVFWVCTCSKYTFDYLDKTIAFGEAFAQTIQIDDTKDEIMNEAIAKRHKVSGYNLWFEEPPQLYLTKKYAKATEQVKQKMLETEFHKDLNRIAKSNFKIAFMYWLRSATKVEGSTIHMRSLKTIDLSFLEHIAAPKLFLLTSVLLHERLQLPHLNELTKLGEIQTKRMLDSLCQNGLLVRDDDYYLINTLLYRQIVNLLKSKNFIH